MLTSRWQCTVRTARASTHTARGARFYHGTFLCVIRRLLQLIHERRKPKEPVDKAFVDTFAAVMEDSVEVRAFLPKAHDDLHPLRVLTLFTRIPDADCELLDMVPEKGRPVNSSSLVRFLPVIQYLLELACGVWVLECGVLTSPRA